jgi:hypothetical protein
MNLTAIGFSANINGMAHAFATRVTDGEIFEFELVDYSIQALIETLEKIYPDWYDASLSIAKRRESE